LLTASVSFCFPFLLSFFFPCAFLLAGGQHKIRQLWRHYYSNTDGLIFVVDSADRDRLKEAAEELQNILKEDDMANCAVLVLANKQDVTDSATTQEVAKAMGLDQERKRSWYVQGCSAKLGDGLYEGMEWLTTTCKKNTKNKTKA
jgi:signal recognition particle receptor subunit beta